MRSVIEMPKTPRSILRDDKGNVAMLFGCALLPVFFFAGAGVDYGRATHARTVLQASADAAVVAAANKAGTNAEKMVVATAVFRGNAQIKVANANVDQTVPTFSTESNTANNTTADVYTFNATTQWGTAVVTMKFDPVAGIIVTPRMDVPTAFMQLVRIRNINVDAQAVADGSTKKLEVAMMIDLTGSMGGKANSSSLTTKIDDLKLAAADFLNILFPNNTATSSNVRVGIVPFADYVNAGPYASAATGLDLNGTLTSARYSQLTNLCRTKQGPWTGTYAGTFASLNTSGAVPTGNQIGGQCGALAPAQSATAPSVPTSSTGATAPSTNASCALPNTTTTSVTTTVTTTYAPVSGTAVALKKDSSNPSHPYGVKVELDDNPDLAGFPYVTSGSATTYRNVKIKSTGNKWDETGDTSNSNAFVKVPTTSTGLTAVAPRTNSGHTGPIGVQISCTSDNCPTTPPTDSTIVKVGTGQGYWNLKQIKKDDGVTSAEYEWNTSGFYVPLYTSYTTAPGSTPSPTVVPTSVTTSASTTNPIAAASTNTSNPSVVNGLPGSGILNTSTVVATTTSTVANTGCSASADTNGTLISCVTEREGTDRYTDAAPSGTANTPDAASWIGSYAHKSTSKSNYSSDGKCYTAGRELPQVIPLTNTRAPLDTFFHDATVGGATPGHIGTAWAWYMLSPSWGSVWSSHSTDSTPAAYADTTTIKAAVLMTDGEYNIHYATETSRNQALAVCSAMRTAGIKIYTIGFGFGATSALDTTSEANARSLLTECAGSVSGTYFFPYDSASLRTAFTVIGNNLTTMTKADIKVTQ